MNSVIKTTKKRNMIKTPGPGRPKGCPNKFTTLKQAFLDVFKEMNGTEGLYAWASKNDRNKALFYGWITKMLPSNIDVEHSGEMNLIISNKFLPDIKNDRDKS